MVLPAAWSDEFLPQFLNDQLIKDLAIGKPNDRYILDFADLNTLMLGHLSGSLARPTTAYPLRTVTLVLRRHILLGSSDGRKSEPGRSQGWDCSGTIAGVGQDQDGTDRNQR